MHVRPKPVGSLLLLIGVFLALELTALGADIWLSRQVERDAAAINTAGRQRMLSQMISKSILTLSQEGEQHSDALTEIRQAHRLFDQTLQAFANGGTTTGADGETIALQRLTSAPDRQLIEAALQNWAPLNHSIGRLLAAGESPASAFIDDTRRLALVQDDLLLRDMNRLTLSLEHSAQETSEKMRNFQSLILLLAMLNALVILRLVLSHLNHSHLNLSMLSQVTDNIDSSVFVTQANDAIINCNQTATRLYRCDKETLRGKKLARLFIDSEASQGVRLDGTTFDASRVSHAVNINGEEYQIVTVHDISPHKAKEATLSRLAYHDPLTQLPNRLLIRDRLEQEIHRSHRYGLRFTLMFIDLDGFKAINDTLGHDSGDLLLQEVAARMKGCSREADTLGRFAGDEFVAIYTGLIEVSQAQKLAQQLIDAIAGITSIAGRPVQVGASIGIAIYPLHGTHSEALMKAADSAMYDAKEAGRNRYRQASTPSRLTAEA
ncbi:diguanylate cyclase domain-containing protein [Aestuariirhabdus litorea]|uniref:Diguanylate cyclase n=1 Tax=Aestuariirhabdus litorea TaxID=2528527 RepID=A0A3P3VNL7_9GAMM|nr:diguanylate cyclase [Aestuariirhabdus litorea]RRJ84014.1 diguanylate cyclase [Aestuariirhabdus litorea]RWW97234.1 diguanylate cyclase [Endozoicomonadaceae bacterium GTF-13]